MQNSAIKSATARDSDFYCFEISNNISKTPEGFLICHDVSLAKTGVQHYLGQELGIPGKDGQIIKIYRLEKDVNTPQTIASFQSKSVTDDHPPVDVSPENYGSYEKGQVLNVRWDAGRRHIVGDIVIKDATLIDVVESKRKREVSSGYKFRYERYKDGYRATNIRANHVAVVMKGRAGPDVAIKDHQSINKRVNSMSLSELKASILQSYITAADRTPAEITQAMKVLDAQPETAPIVKDTDSNGLMAAMFKFMSGGAKDKRMADEDMDEDKKDKDKDDSKADDSINARMTRIEDALVALAKGRDAEGDEKADKDDDKEAAADDDDSEGDEKEKKAADSAFISISKKALAAIPEKFQKTLKDSARQPSGKNTYAKISAIVQERSKSVSAFDSATPGKSVEDLGKAIMAARNPHYQAKNDIPESLFWGK